MVRRLPPDTINELNDMANKLRIHSVKSTSLAKSGHPTSCSSIAEIISVLFFHTLRMSTKSPRHQANDRFVLSKGHAAPILYAAWAEAGSFPINVLDNLRKFPYDLEGCPTPRLEFIDIATGSSGIGLNVAAGMAYVGKYLDKSNYKIYCLLGDGELEEGCVWEAFSFISYYKLNNLCIILDCNRFGENQPTCLANDPTNNICKARLESFGLKTIIVDGHNVEELVEAFGIFQMCRNSATCIIAKTIKGKNFPSIEGILGWHAKVLGNKSASVVKHLESLMNNKDIKLKIRSVQNPSAPCINIGSLCACELPKYKKGSAANIMSACGKAISKMVRSHPRVIALHSYLSDSSVSEQILKLSPEQASSYLQCFMAEQNMLGVGIGLTCRNRCIVYCTTFAGYLCRAHDQIRIGAISRTNINICGSHCGISAGEDGPVSMALEDIAMFRVIPDCTILYPSDAVSCEKAVELAANISEMCYIRVNNCSSKVIYPNKEKFEVGKAKVLKKSDEDKCLVIAAGPLVHEALKAQVEFEKDTCMQLRIMDLFSIKPIDKEAILQNCADCKGRIVTVEDHYPEGGIGEAVLAACSGKCDILISRLAIQKIPRSGAPEILMDYYGISSNHIVQAVKDLLSCSCD